MSRLLIIKAENCLFLDKRTTRVNNRVAQAITNYKPTELVIVHNKGTNVNVDSIKFYRGNIYTVEGSDMLSKSRVAMSLKGVYKFKDILYVGESNDESIERDRKVAVKMGLTYLRVEDFIESFRNEDIYQS